MAATTRKTYADFVRDALTRVPSIACEDARDRLERSEPTFLLDVREEDEYEDGVLPGSVLLPRGLVEKHVHEHIPDCSATVIVCCSTGNRSALVADVLYQMGFGDVRNLTGGIERWKHLNFPTSGVSAVCMTPGAKLDWHDVRREFAIVQRRVPVLGTGSRELVYLDHAASTHAPRSVVAAYTEFLEREYANVHRGTHVLSRKATERFEEAYYVVADYLGAELSHGSVCFTQNTTHAIDLASHSMAALPGKVITTEMEHHSNELPHRSRGPVLRCRVTDSGELDLEHLESLLRHNDVKLVALTAGSNVTGVINDIHRVARMAHDAGALVLVDAAQALARMPIDVKSFDSADHIDFLAAAGHKAYAPFGAGFLYGPRDLLAGAPPYMPGGGTASQVTARSVHYLDSADRHHGGTPNIAGVVGMTKALLFLQSLGLDEVREHERRLTAAAIHELEAIGGVTVYGPSDADKRLAVLSFNVDGVDDLMTAAILSEEGALAVRNGRFCAHIYMDRLLQSHHPSAKERPQGAVRASFGLYNNESDVDRLVEFVKRVRSRKWVGKYRMKGDKLDAEFAGRCADRWMESTGSPQTSEAEHYQTDFLFEVLHPDWHTRAYLFADRTTGEAAILDPVREHVSDYLEFLGRNDLRLKYTIETHTHADHLSGSVRLKDLTGAKMIMHASALAPCVDVGVDDGDEIRVGDVRAEVMHTPGHTLDSICLLLPGRVLTGDTLLIGGCGRSDLPTGDAKDLYASLARIKGLPADTLVFPGHDYNGKRASTVEAERDNHRLVLDENAFVNTMNDQRLPPPGKLEESLSFNQQCR
jgi:cysteine desulfurase / selenocysteine lyase